MKHLIVALAALLALASVLDGRSHDSDKECRGLGKRAVALIGQYRELRERSRQLSDGTYDKDLRDHGGKLHRVLVSLGIELGHPPNTKQTIIDCVGEPDAVRNARQMAGFLEIYKRESRRAGREINEKKDREYLIYYWRSGHDFLFFISEGGLIVDHGWWFAYE